MPPWLRWCCLRAHRVPELVLRTRSVLVDAELALHSDQWREERDLVRQHPEQAVDVGLQQDTRLPLRPGLRGADCALVSPTETIRTRTSSPTGTPRFRSSVASPTVARFVYSFASTHRGHPVRCQREDNRRGLEAISSIGKIAGDQRADSLATMVGSDRARRSSRHAPLSAECTGQRSL